MIAPYDDTRPRYMYTLPDGTNVWIIFDHDETPPPTITFTMAGGQVIEIPRAP